jgi:pimeloyl-ACP methyl ester carboxylesterase
MERQHIAFVPGLNCTGALFRPQIDALGSDHDIRVADHSADDSIAGIAKALLAAAPPRFALAGLSVGGYVALEVMRQAPRRVTRLALLDTRASPDNPQDAEIRHMLIKLAEIGKFNDVHPMLWPRLVNPERFGDKALEEIVRMMADETGPKRFIRQQRAVLARADLRDELGAIRCPTLVLVGDQDAITPPFMSEDMASVIPGSTLTVVPDCGHLSTLERPEAVTQALVQWLAS